MDGYMDRWKEGGIDGRTDGRKDRQQGNIKVPLYPQHISFEPLCERKRASGDRLMLIILF
jgi:hypothetical protein